MYVRLAFAVAAFLEPEILIVDEVLAVGDAEFQKKAIGKMQDISRTGGRTVLFVSHNMAAVKSLCTRGIVLEHGKVVLDSTVENAVNYYLSGNSETQNKKIFSSEYDKKEFLLHEICLNPVGKSSDFVLDEFQEIEINTVISIKEENHNLQVTYVLNNEMGEPLFTFSHINNGLKLISGLNKLTCILPKGFLNIGTYYLSLYVIENSKTTLFVEKDIISFAVQEGERALGSWMGKEPGFIKPKFDWILT
jgi:lipopolysaccharide transport system ATP-binding protein